MASDPRRPTDAELEILTVLWSIGPATVREVHDVIGRRRPAQYSTVLKFMQIMAEKGLVRRDQKQRAHIYEATRPREWTQRQLAEARRQRVARRPHGNGREWARCYRYSLYFSGGHEPHHDCRVTLTSSWLSSTGMFTCCSTTCLPISTSPA